VRLIVSVSGADDGLPRSGLAVSKFDVVSVVSGEDTAPRQQLISQAVEGPAGVYQLVLEGDDQPSTLLAKMTILAIMVNGSTESGWADDRGQIIAVGGTP
jgi:cell division septal protein FtsQ